MDRVQMILKCSSAVAAVVVFAGIYLLGRGNGTENMLLRAYREFAGLLRKQSSDSNFYHRSSRWLRKNGAAFHYGEWVEPIRFLVLRIVLGLLGLGIVSGMGGAYGAAAFVFLYFLPVWMLLYLNKKDNEKMLPELKLMYHALEIQIRAGIYITDALAECYGSVRERRIRQALLDLAGDIVLKADIYDSLEKFQGKFDNRYVDSLCITITQALESGQAVELLRDIGEQIKDMETALQERKKASLDRKITFCQLGILAVVLGLAIYACVSYMLGSATLF